jgi:hypothetical protein
MDGVWETLRALVGQARGKTDEELLQQYWDLQGEMNALPQDEYEDAKGEWLNARQGAVNVVLEERLGKGWNEQPEHRREPAYA